MPSTLVAVAGDPVAVAGAARSMAAIAGDVARQAAVLRSLANSSSCWSGKAAAGAQTRSATLPPKLDKVTASYGGAGRALLDYAQAVADAQRQSRSAIGAAQRAEADLQAAQQAQAAAARADAAAAAAARAACQVAPPPTAPRYEGVIDDASSRFARAVAANDDAHAAQKAAANRAASALKAAARQGIPNQSWWHHVTSSVAHWTSTHWRAALAKVAAAAGKLSMLASIAAVVLAIGGMFFPPLEAFAAAAEAEAVVFGVLAGVGATTVELSQKQTRDDGMVSLALLAMPPAAKGLQRLIPARAINLSRTSIVDDANATTRAVPLGFASGADFEHFGSRLRTDLNDAGYPDTVGIMQGSSVTGVQYRTGQPFDGGPDPSDYDVALAGSDLFEAVKKLGIPLRGKSTRTGELTPHDLQRLGLDTMSDSLSRLAGRPVKFMVYDAAATAVGRSQSIGIRP